MKTELANYLNGETAKLKASQRAGNVGRTALCWIVVNPDGKLLAVLDSESEAYFFTRNRGHANGSVYFKAPCDYAAAPDMLAALKNLVNDWERVHGAMPSDHEASAAIAKATGK